MVTSSACWGGGPRAPRSASGSSTGSSDEGGQSIRPDSSTPWRVSLTAATSGSAASAARTSSPGTKSSPLNPMNTWSSDTCPKRSGCAAASSTPSANVSAADHAQHARPPRPAGPGTRAPPARRGPRSRAKLVPTVSGHGRPRTRGQAGDARSAGCGSPRRRRATPTTRPASGPAATSERDQHEAGEQHGQVGVSPGRRLEAGRRCPSGTATRRANAAPTPTTAPATAASAGPAAAAIRTCRGGIPTAASDLQVLAGARRRSAPRTGRRGTAAAIEGRGRERQEGVRLEAGDVLRVVRHRPPGRRTRCRAGR